MTAAAPSASPHPALDVDALRSRFPSLDPAGPGGGWALFDAPGGTQTPREVGEAAAAALTGPLSNRGAASPSQQLAERAVADFRAAAADLLDADARGVVHGRSATALTYDLSRALARTWRPGDEVVLSRLDHDANVRPWVQAAERAGAVVRWLDLDAQAAELVLDDDGDVPGLGSVLSERTRLVAVTGASNLLGTRPPLRRLADAAHAVGALLWVDGVHATAHELPSLRASGADFWVCSPYKFLGPHCGVLAADPALLETLHPDKLVPSTDAVPERFELGTLPYEQLAGVTAAVDVLAGLVPSSAGQGSRRERLAASFAAAEAHEDRLRARVEEGLAELAERGAVVVHSRAADRTPTLYFSTPGRDAAAVSASLAQHRVLAPAGWFYAEEPYRALQRAGALDGPGIRVGTAPYTSDDDVTRLLDALRAVL